MVILLLLSDVEFIAQVVESRLAVLKRIEGIRSVVGISVGRETVTAAAATQIARRLI